MHASARDEHEWNDLPWETRCRPGGRAPLDTEADQSAADHAAQDLLLTRTVSLPAGELYRLLLDAMPDAAYFVDRQRRILYWNAAAEQITGHRASEMIGQLCNADHLNHVDAEGQPLCQAGCPLTACMRDGEPIEAHPYLRHADGHRLPVRARSFPVRRGGTSGEIIGACQVFDDASQRQQAERQAEALRDLAWRDCLTGLSNRRFLEEQLATRLAPCRAPRAELGILIIDIDHFKAVNDRFGHAAGDAALQVIARTLSGALRPDDLLGRWGGEEFVVLLEGGLDVLQAVGDRICALSRQSRIVLGTEHVDITVSIGGTLCAPDDDPATLLARADQALYRAKFEGRDRSVYI